MRDYSLVILKYNKGIISHLLRLDHITTGYVLLITNLVEVKRRNTGPILIVNRTEWSRLIGYLGLSIEANPSRVGKNNVYLSILGIYQTLHM